MGKLVVTEFVSLDGVMEDRVAQRGTSTAAGRSSSTAAPRETSSSSTS